MLLFNQYIVASLFWWFYPHLRQGNTPVGHWFVRCSFFPVWGRCNFLILLLNTDLKAVLPQPSQVVTACLAPHIASESSYLSWLYFRICTLSPSSARETESRLASYSLSSHCMQGHGKQGLFSIYYYRFYFVVFYLESWYNTISSSGWANTPVRYQLSLI